MRKKQSQEESSEETETGHSESYSLPQRRHKTTYSDQQPSRIFYSDEHPEIPKIRRASRYSRVADGLPTTPAKRRRSAYSGADEPPTEVQPVRRNKQQKEVPVVPGTTSKILVALRRGLTVYKPPLLIGRSYLPGLKSAHRIPELQGARRTRVYDRKYKRRQLHSLLISFQQFALRKKLMVMGGMLVAILLLALIVTIKLSSQDTQIQTNGQSNNMVFHTTGGNSSHQIVITPPKSDRPAPPVLATSAYVLDADTGATLYASNPFMHLPMLSTTKLMTALVAVQIGDLNQSILINDAIANDINQLAGDSSLMGITRGETYTLKDLLYGLLLVSGNDAAIAIADQLGGGNQQKFVDKMNQEAAKLKLRDTHYMNPHGLPQKEHFSSAHDLALLGKYSLSVPLIHTISNTRKYDIPKNNQHKDHNMLNGNQFLWWYSGVDGGKPGWDTATNFVQVISCKRNQRHLIGVVIHTADWWTDMRNLMNWGFNTFDWISPREVNSPSNPIPFAAAWYYFDKDKKENTIPTPDQGRYYIYTGYSISGLIMAYFDKNGGLKTFGYPTSQAKALSDRVLSQRFEHSTIRCDLRTKQCKKA